MDISIPPIGACTACAVLSVGTATAQDNSLARTYEVTAKPGLAAELETAIMQPAQWREAVTYRFRPDLSVLPNEAGASQFEEIQNERCSG